MSVACLAEQEIDAWAQTVLYPRISPLTIRMHLTVPFHYYSGPTNQQDAPESWRVFTLMYQTSIVQKHWPIAITALHTS